MRSVPGGYYPECVGKSYSRVIPLRLINMSRWFVSITEHMINKSLVLCYAMRYVNALEVFNPLLTLLNQLGPGWCLLLHQGGKNGPFKQVFTAQYYATKGMRRCIIHAGVQPVSLEPLLCRQNLPVAPGHQMFHRPGLHVSQEPFAASGYRATLFWEGFVSTNMTPEITLCPLLRPYEKINTAAETGCRLSRWEERSEQQDVSVLPSVYLGLKCTSKGENLSLTFLDLTPRFHR